jgi:hypothetical protein
MFTAPIEVAGVIAPIANTPALDLTTVSWASLRSSGIEGQVNAHVAGLDGSTAEDPTTALVIRTLYQQAVKHGPMHLARGQLDNFLSGDPLPVLDLVVMLARISYGLKTIAASLDELGAFVGANGDLLPVEVPPWTNPIITVDPITMRGPRRIIPQS